MILRLSQKLNAKIKGGTLPEQPPDLNPVADWSARLFLAAFVWVSIVTVLQMPITWMNRGRP